jgi:hypothetical protein
MSICAAVAMPCFSIAGNRSQERHVTGAAANVEHAHALPDAGSAQHFFRQLAEEPALSDQTLQFIVIVAEGVIVRGTVVHRPQLPRAGRRRLVPSDAVVS